MLPKCREIPVPSDMKEMMLDMVDKYGVVGYRIYNNAWFIIYKRKELANTIGECVASELRQKFNKYLWIPTTLNEVVKAGIDSKAVFVGWEWLPITEEVWEE